MRSLMPQMRGWTPRAWVVLLAVSGLLVYLAMQLLRLQLASELQLSWTQALDAGLAVGWSYDLGATALLAGLAAGSALGRVSPLWLWLPSMGVLWISSLANVLHFRFFQLRLDWWVVRLHWRDAFLVGDSATDLSGTWRIVTSAIVFVVALAVAIAGEWLRRRHADQTPHVTAPWPRRAAPAVALALIALVGFRLPHWAATFRLTGMVLSDQILRVWWYELTRGKMAEGARTHWIADVSADEGMTKPAAVLAELRRYGAQQADGETPREPAAIEHGDDLRPMDPAWPLLAELVPDGEQTTAMRRALGVPEQGPLNVIVLFVESLRAFELDDARLGPAVYPQLSKIFAEQAIYFTQAYSSSLAAGETVRGEFSTLCGMMPNVLGPATYIANATISVHCTQELMRRTGHRTLWMSSYYSTFHSKRSFEMLHGTELFFDHDYFTARGITAKVGNWGLADGPVLQEAVNVLEEHASSGAPVFSNITTISTHHPHTVVPEGPLPDWLLTETADRPSYQGYLSRLRYADTAVSAFLTRLFTGPMRENTVVVVLGDHSITEKPLGDVSPVQRIEAQFRIPIALVSAHAKAAVYRHPVHQADVAPTLARLVGASGPVAWTGRGLLGETGTPWIYETRTALHYRTRERACYTLRANERPTCFDVRAHDPLHTGNLETVPEVPADTAFFHRVLVANLNALSLNQIAPRLAASMAVARPTSEPHAGVSAATRGTGAAQ